MLLFSFLSTKTFFIHSFYCSRVSCAVSFVQITPNRPKVTPPALVPVTATLPLCAPLMSSQVSCEGRGSVHSGPRVNTPRLLEVEKMTKPTWKCQIVLFYRHSTLARGLMSINIFSIVVSIDGRSWQLSLSQDKEMIFEKQMKYASNALRQACENHEKSSTYFFFLVSSIPSQSVCEQDVWKKMLYGSAQGAIMWRRGRTGPSILLWLSQISGKSYFQFTLFVYLVYLVYYKTVQGNGLFIQGFYVCKVISCLFKSQKQLDKLFFMSIDPTELNSERRWKPLQQKPVGLV